MWHEHNSQKIINGEKNMDTIIDLKPATVYHFRLYAQNQLGTSPPSDVLQVRFATFSLFTERKNYITRF